MKSRIAALGLVGVLVAAGGVRAFVDDQQNATDSAKKDAVELPPFPADAAVKQTARTSRGVLNYTAAVGSLPVRDEKGKKTADVVYTAYTLADQDSGGRPV